MEVKLRPGGADKSYPARPRPKVDRRCGEDSGLNERRSLKLGNEQESLGTGGFEGWCDRCGKAGEEGRERRRRARGK